MKRKFDLNEIKNYLNNMPKNSKIYLGCDSELICEKRKEKKVRYVITLVIHKGAKFGAKVFGEVIYINYKEVYDGNLKKPYNRLFKEAELLVNAYEKLKNILKDYKIELHIDINPNKKEGSSIVYESAKGFIFSMTGIKPKVKPNAFAATCCADFFCKSLSRKE